MKIRKYSWSRSDQEVIIGLIFASVSFRKVVQGAGMTFPKGYIESFWEAGVVERPEYLPTQIIL